MMIKRIIATFLAALMLFASFAIVINAEEADQGANENAQEPVYEFNTDRNKPAMDYLTGQYTYTDENGKEVKDVVDTKEERLALMDLRLQKGDYRLYVDAYSGEVAVEQISTGEILFSNPYDVGTKVGNSDNDKKTKSQLLSQVIVNFKNITEGDTDGSYDSYTYAVKGGDLKNTTPSQVKVRYMQDGIRVDYSVGRMESRYLVPERMEATAFENMILNVAVANGMTKMERMQLEAYYKKYDLSDPKYEKTPEFVEGLLKTYPMLQKTVDGQTVNVPCYVLKSDTTMQEMRNAEFIIKKYCLDFTYEELDNQHLALNYEPKDRVAPLFKVALEYTLNENGLAVRLPANGIRFDESLFRLVNIDVLPYMGAGTSSNKGYSFFPDGSGTLFSFEQTSALSSDTIFSGTIYGADFGYYDMINEGPHNEVVRYPVFGIAETEKDKTTGEERDRGFVAIIEEGESLTTLRLEHSTKHYNTIKMRINPRPSDKVKPAGTEKAWTVVSERKYTGSFRIHYRFLSDEDIVAEKGGYTADYVGMAKAYRDYLVANGTLTKLTEADVKANLPIYIETFGSIETTKKFLSIPYKTNVALTSFSDVKTMYDELSANGVDNINFILTGYAKGGLTKDTIPYKLKWDSSVKKGYDLEDLLSDANGKFGVYPDFDFAYASNNKLFDGLTLDKHAVKTIDGRYTSKREYSATRQTFINYYEMAISPAYFNRFYEKITGDYLKMNPQGISVSTLGNSLSSDFDEDEPYNREDSKNFTEQAFAYFDKNYARVISSGGNAFTWKYVDVLTDVATDSSRHSKSAATVPFLGIVLHGYVETASSPINMEGNIDYAMLRAIENGTAFKFLLSYDNTELLKEYYDTSVYYSIRYDIWLSDVIARYEQINSALKDVQTSTIEKHEFIPGIRIPENSELSNDAEDALAAAIAKEKADADVKKEELRVQIQKLRADILKYNNELTTWEGYESYNKVATAFIDALDAYKATITAKGEAEVALEVATKAHEDAKAAAAAKTEELTPEQTAELDAAVEAARLVKNDAEAVVADATEKYNEAKATAKAAYADYLAKLADVEFILDASESCAAIKANVGLFEKHNAYTDGIRKELIAQFEAVDAKIADFEAKADIINGNTNNFAAELAESYPELLPEVVEPEAQPEEVVDEDEYNKYAAAETSIVYEQYSNGKTFVLNFNNFAVKVEIGGIYYMIAAYGYIEIK